MHIRLSPFFVIIGISIVGFNPVFGQELEYLDVTGDEKTRLNIDIKPYADGKKLLFTNTEIHALHFFSPIGDTKKWTHKDSELHHDFEAIREGDEIKIQGVFKGEKIQKTVQIDDKPWFNKLDHGLSDWVTGQDDALVFWVLKLSADLDPIEFKAEKVGEETLILSGEKFQTIKVKLCLDGVLLSKLWSAYLWYDVKSGLFLKFEGTNGGPGSELTTITLDQQITP